MKVFGLEVTTRQAFVNRLGGAWANGFDTARGFLEGKVLGVNAELETCRATLKAIIEQRNDLEDQLEQSDACIARGFEATQDIVREMQAEIDQLTDQLVWAEEELLNERAGNQ